MAFQAYKIEEIIIRLQAFEDAHGIRDGGLTQHAPIMLDFMHGYGRAKYLLRPLGTAAARVVIHAYLTGIRGGPLHPIVSTRTQLVDDGRSEMGSLQAFSVADTALRRDSAWSIYGIVALEDISLQPEHRGQLGFLRAEGLFHVIWPPGKTIMRDLPISTGVPVVDVLRGLEGRIKYG